MKYLMNEQLRANLSVGKAVEQWLSPRQHENYVALRYLTIYKERNGTYSTSYIECFDDGDENFIDIGEFSALHPDEPAVLNTFDAIGEALQFVLDTYNATMDKFVAAGMIQEEYRDYLKSR